MRNKCKICGYHFKDKDEIICPECFTAREDDITCGQFSSEEHSHKRYDVNSTFREREFFSDNETFEEKRTSYAERTLKKEDRERPPEFDPSANFTSNEIPNSLPHNLQNSLPNNTSNSLPINPTNTLPNNVAFNPNPNSRKQNGCGCGCSVIIVILIILGVAIGFIINNLDDDEDYEIESTQYEENDEENNFDFHCNKPFTVENDDERFMVTQDYYDGVFWSWEMLNSEGLDTFTAMSGEGDYYKIYSHYSVDVAYNEDYDKLVLDKIECIAYDNDGNVLSVSEDWDLQNSTDKILVPNMYADARAENIAIMLTFTLDEKTQTISFSVDKNAKE